MADEHEEGRAESGKVVVRGSHEVTVPLVVTSGKTDIGFKMLDQQNLRRKKVMET